MYEYELDLSCWCSCGIGARSAILFDFIYAAGDLESKLKDEDVGRCLKWEGKVRLALLKFYKILKALCHRTNSESFRAMVRLDG